VREREALELRQELSQAKAELVSTKKAATEEVRSAREATVLEFWSSMEQVLQFANHALGTGTGMAVIL
jgi:alanine racemase